MSPIIPAILLVSVLGFVGCKSPGTEIKSSSTRPGASRAPIDLVLWDAQGGATALPNNEASKNSLMQWVATHPHAQEKFPAQKPRFLLLSVKDGMITDTIPIAASAGGKPLTSSDSAALKSCFQGGETVTVNLGTKIVTRR